jgi:hypothetical protein
MKKLVSWIKSKLKKQKNQKVIYIMDKPHPVHFTVSKIFPKRFSNSYINEVIAAAIGDIIVSNFKEKMVILEYDKDQIRVEFSIDVMQ